MTTRNSGMKPLEKLRYVRASVANQCNLDCIYCPKKSGMENFVPERLRNHRLATDDYLRNLAHLAAAGVDAISFTGGEPTLNKDLPILVEGARDLFTRVEMTTNGRNLARHMERLVPHIDIMKVSMDTTDPELSHQIIRGQRADYGRARDAVRAALAAGCTVGINIVAMRRNIGHVDGIIEFARQLRAETGGEIYVSVLDLYYSDEQRQLWQDEFIPLNDLIGTFRERWGEGDWQQRRGTEFGWFDTGGVQVRFKDSYASTYRSARCDTCPTYCQEGMYAFKHSVEGWVTLCPSNAEEMGVLLRPGLDTAEAVALLQPMMDELASTRRVDDSFAQLVRRRGLTLAAV